MTKKKLAITGLLLLSLILFGCSKEKPKEGYYQIFLNYETPGLSDDWSSFTITESTEDYIIINHQYKLEKKGKNISGGLLIGSSSGFIIIQGKWSYNLFKNKYYIKGTFTRDITHINGPQQFATGTFEIKSLK